MKVDRGTPWTDYSRVDEKKLSIKKERDKVPISNKIQHFLFFYIFLMKTSQK